MRGGAGRLQRLHAAFFSMLREERISYLTSRFRLSLENYRRANSALWVTSLCYYTVLSLAPIMAILFSLGSWLGIGEYLISQIKLHSPLNEEAMQVITGFADRLLDNARNGVLAGVGFIFLGWTLVSMFSVIEKAFNDIWQVKESRVLLRKITDYFSFLIFTPVFILAVNGTTSVIARRLQIHSWLSFYVGKLIPYLAILIFFTALYMLMPNTKVRFGPAFVSAVFASVVCTIFQYSFLYLQNSITSYNKIYGSFATIFIFVFWLRILWFFIILGGHVSYLLQHRHLHPTADDANLSFKSREMVALLVVLELMKRYRDNLPPGKPEELAKLLNLPLRYVSAMLRDLAAENVVAEVVARGEDENGYVLTRNMEEFTYGDLFRTLEAHGKDLLWTELPNLEPCLEIIELKDDRQKLMDLLF
ncbi:MAG: YihY/virulence factor BrkB family protein [Fusobacteriaceae bacterium]|jgi:membrane protein|nr:YihY/virulence factor BrkB family protein [Fusobacteriaceae bacterium]